MNKVTLLTLATLLAFAGCKATSNPSSASTPAPIPSLVFWAVPPSPIMVRQYDPVAPTLPCVTVQVSQPVSGPAVDGGAPYLVEGAPLKGIDVKLGKNPGGNCAERTTDENGQAQFCGVPFTPGAYTLNATVAGAEPLQSAPFLVPDATVALTWSVQPQVAVFGQAIVGEKGQCPTVVARQVVDAADAGAPYLVEGAPLKGIDVKLGKNPGGGCAARTTTDENGVAQFCNVIADQPGAVTYSAALSLPDGGDVVSPYDPLYFPTAPNVSVPLYVSPNPYVIQWTGQPAVEEKAGEMIGPNAAEACNVGVTVYNTTGLADGGSAALLVEQPGTPAAGVVVTFQQVPAIGSPVTVTTDANGVATLCGSSFTFAGVQGMQEPYAIQASASGAQAKFSAPIIVAD